MSPSLSADDIDFTGVAVGQGRHARSESPPVVRGKGVEVPFSYGGDGVVVVAGDNDGGAAVLPREWSTAAVAPDRRSAPAHHHGSAATPPGETASDGSASGSRAASPDSEDDDMDDAFPPELMLPKEMVRTKWALFREKKDLYNIFDTDLSHVSESDCVLYCFETK